MIRDISKFILDVYVKWKIMSFIFYYNVHQFFSLDVTLFMAHSMEFKEIPIFIKSIYKWIHVKAFFVIKVFFHSCTYMLPQTPKMQNFDLGILYHNHTSLYTKTLRNPIIHSCIPTSTLTPRQPLLPLRISIFECTFSLSVYIRKKNLSIRGKRAHER